MKGYFYKYAFFRKAFFAWLPVVFGLTKRMRQGNFLPKVNEDAMSFENSFLELDL